MYVAVAAYARVSWKLPGKPLGAVRCLQQLFKGKSLFSDASLEDLSALQPILVSNYQFLLWLVFLQKEHGLFGNSLCDVMPQSESCDANFCPDVAGEALP